MEQKKRLRGRPKAFDDKSQQNRIQSLDRALDVLDCVADGGGLTLTEIAEALDQSTATIYRILSTFSARNALEMDPVSQEWFVGPASYRAGSAFLKRTGLLESARPVMRDLMADTGETANMGVENKGQVLFLSQVETDQNIRAFFPPGSQSPMHASGIGKALLAFSDTRHQEKYIATQKLETFTENTIGDAATLRDELAKIRAAGFAVDDEEKNKGMRCVAAPVFNSFKEVVAGISVSGPSERLSRSATNGIGENIKTRVAALSAGLGYEP